MRIGPGGERARQIRFTGGVDYQAAPAITKARLDDKRGAECRAIRFVQFEFPHPFARHDHRVRHIQSRRNELRMQPGLVEGGQRGRRWINDLRPESGGELDQLMVNVRIVVMLAVHVQQHPDPDFATLEVFPETFDPERLDQEKVHPLLRAMLLDAVNEKIIRVELVRHHEVVNPGHAKDYLAAACRLSIVPAEKADKHWIAGRYRIDSSW